MSQMVDRAWWLWQNAHPNNTNAFFDGSVQNLTYYDESPNGAPLWLSMESLIPGDGILMEGVPLGEVWITEGDFCAIPMTTIWLGLNEEE
jgi:tyrosinase